MKNVPNSAEIVADQICDTEIQYYYAVYALHILKIFFGRILHHFN